MLSVIPSSPPTVQDVQDEIVQWAAILASITDKNEAADFLEEVAGDLRRLQPVDLDS